uniref:Uncharacterized protein n=1 Tax=Parascaris univalens TaxID=6257 RepID=A0A915A3V2_PARUN
IPAEERPRFCSVWDGTSGMSVAIRFVTQLEDGKISFSSRPESGTISGLGGEQTDARDWKERLGMVSSCGFAIFSDYLELGHCGSKPGFEKLRLSGGRLLHKIKSELNYRHPNGL